MRLIIHGAAGHMGRLMTAAANTGKHGAVVAGLVDGYAKEGDGICSSFASCDVEADCVVDFSNAALTEGVLDFCVARKLALVLATTGQSDEQRAAIERASKQIPIFFTANMSIGVAVLSDLVRRAAAAFPDADIEIVERHHHRKVDVPSGTALMLARAAQQARGGGDLVVGRHENGARKSSDIGIHSLRVGDDVGTHEVIIGTGTETLTLRHDAGSRALFADGALAAAAFIVGRPAGLYDMKDLLAEGARA